MLESVLLPTLRVPTCVGCSLISGGSLFVYLGSQRVARAVVSCLATASGEDILLDDAVSEREAGWRLEEVGLEEAVVKVARRMSGKCE